MRRPKHITGGRPQTVMRVDDMEAYRANYDKVFAKKTDTAAVPAKGDDEHGSRPDRS